MGTLDYGRDNVDKIVRDVGNNWWALAREMAAPLLTSAVEATANTQKIDSDYLWWRLLNDQRSWGMLPRSEMLDMAVRLTLVSVGRDHGPDSRFDLSDEAATAKALASLVKWADTAFAGRAVDLLLDVAGRSVKQVQQAMVGITGEQISEKQARLVILVDLPLRVEDHPFWFKDPQSVRTLLGRIMRKG